jgi:hypothetical protein
MGEVAVMEEKDINKRSPGRPDLYPALVKPHLDDIYNWVAEGNTEQSICHKLGIHRDTWIRYKDNYVELTDTIIRARSAAGELLLNKQFSAACGQTVTLNKQKVTKDGDVVDITEDMYIAPNVNAAEFWSRHMYPGYIPPKGDPSGSIVINNFQLPQLEADLAQIAEKRKALEALLHTDYEVIDEG